MRANPDNSHRAIKIVNTSCAVSRRGQTPGNDRSSMLDSLPPMDPAPQHSARKLSYSRLLLLALLCLAGTACSTTAPTGKVLFEDPRGSVSLQTISDPSIQASHPINLEPALLAQLLTGIEIHDDGHGTPSLVSQRFCRTAIYLPPLLGRSDPVSRSTACGGLTYGNRQSVCRVSCGDYARRF